jgi:hypothetical protein
VEYDSLTNITGTVRETVDEGCLWVLAAKSHSIKAGIVDLQELPILFHDLRATD